MILKLAAPELPLFMSNRVIIFVLLALGLGFAFQRVLSTTQERAQALQDALDIAQREAETNRALLEAERNYNEARETALRHGQQLVTASHDIKQPLMSLRSLVDAATHDQPMSLRTDLQRAFNYLEDLAGSYVAHGEVLSSHEDAQNGGDHDPSPEAAPVSMFVETLDRMFRSEAEASGLQFDARSVETEIIAQPLPLMRILSNLLSNAIKHTDTGLVRIEAETAGAVVQISISNTGAALDADDVAALKRFGKKGAASDGSGVGLAIVHDHAEAQGFALRFSRDPEGPSNRFTLDVPVQQTLT